jgi:hypothetical protein
VGAFVLLKSSSTSDWRLGPGGGGLDTPGRGGTNGREGGGGSEKSICTP